MSKGLFEDTDSSISVTMNFILQVPAEMAQLVKILFELPLSQQSVIN